MLSSSIYLKHSTAQHSAISRSQSSKVNTCRSKRDNARNGDRVGESQHVVEHSYSSRCSQNEEIKICPAYKNIQSTATHRATLLILIIRCCSVVCSRAPPDPPRLRGRATSRPRSSPRDPRRKNGHRLQTRRARTFNTVGFPEAANDLSFSFGSAVERSIVVNQSSVWSLAYRRVLHLFYLFAPFLPTLKPIRFVAAGLPGSPPH